MRQRVPKTGLIEIKGYIGLLAVRPWIKIVGQLAVSGVLLSVVLEYVDFEKVKKLLADANPLLLIILFLIYAADRVFMAWKWQWLLKTSGHSIKVYHALRSYYISSFIGFAVPLGGLGPDIVRYALLKKIGIPSEALSMSIVMERLLGLLGTLLMVMVGLVVFLNLIEDLVWRSSLFGVFAVCGLSTFLFAAVIFHTGFRQRVFRLIRLDRILQWNKLKKFLQALVKYKERPGVLLGSVGLAFLEQFFPILAVFVAAQAISVPLSLTECLAVVPVTTVLQRLPISFGGLGVREGALVVLLGAFGITSSSAVVLGLVTFTFFVISMLPGAVWLVFHREETVINEN